MPTHSQLVPLLLAALVLAAVPPATTAATPPAQLLILDVSGSMWGQLEGENKIVIARRVLRGLVDGLDEEARIGLIAYGHRREGDCEDIETVVPIGPLDKAGVNGVIEDLKPKGKTPLTGSLEKAFDELSALDGSQASVILVSDGLETCGGDPCALVRQAKEQGIEFRLHIVGFDLAGEDLSQLECAAQAGDGLFLLAEDAEELSAALDRAVAEAPQVPPGRLAVKAVADGELQDATVLVTAAGSGDEAGAGRTYTSADTNPRLIPLPDGEFEVVVRAVGIKGDAERRFPIEIRDGSRVDKVVDFSTGELMIGVSRNGELSDAVYRVRQPGTGEEVAGGRTYTHARSNPARVRLTAGTYEVGVGSVEISGRPWHELGSVEIQPRSVTELVWAWTTGTLEIGAARDGELVDATLNVVSVETGKPVGQGRTYTSASSNPRSFVLLPGEYRVTVSEIRGPRKEITVSVPAGETVERMVDPAAD